MFLTRTRQDWLDHFARYDVMAAPVLSIKESMAFFADRMDALVIETEHQKLGKLREVRVPITFSSGPATVGHAAPTLGQHTQERLRKTGFSDQQIGEWKEKGLV